MCREPLFGQIIARKQFRTSFASQETLKVPILTGRKAHKSHINKGSTYSTCDTVTLGKKNLK